MLIHFGQMQNVNLCQTPVGLSCYKSPIFKYEKAWLCLPRLPEY